MLYQSRSGRACEYHRVRRRYDPSLVLSGRSQQLQDINFIFSHGGGVLTAVIERLEIPSVNAAAKNKLSSAAVDAELARFHYDTAQVSTGVTIRALAQLVPVTQIVFGSDYPYRTPLEHVESLSAAFGLEQLKAIERENALGCCQGSRRDCVPAPLLPQRACNIGRTF